MEIVNWEGSAIFGPGSEWFWSMASFVVVVVSLAGIYRQLRAQGAANAVQRMEALQGQWASDWLRYSRLVLATDLKSGPINNRTMVKARPLLNFISNLDDLYRAGHITVTEISEGWGQSILMSTAAMTPLVERERVVHGNPHIYEYEGLLADLRRVEAKTGALPRRLDAPEVEAWLDFVIEAVTEEMRLQQEWKSGVIPTPVSLGDATGPARL